MKKFIERLDNLIETGTNIMASQNSKQHGSNKENQDAAMKHMAWSMSCKNLLEKLSMQMFLVKFKEIENGKDYPAYKTSEIIGLLESARSEIENGFIHKIEHILHAELFDSILEQAKELLKKGHKVPAAVLARIVVEKWLHDIADQHSIDISDKPKAMTINERMKKDGIFETPKWRTVASHLDTGNSAAHGNDDKFEESNVESMFMFIENNCIQK